jgi:hypothetical protein
MFNSRQSDHWLLSTPQPVMNFYYPLLSSHFPLIFATRLVSACYDDCADDVQIEIALLQQGASNYPTRSFRADINSNFLTLQLINTPRLWLKNLYPLLFPSAGK